MSIFNQITRDIKAAMKAREKDKLEALRAIKSALMLAKTEKGPNHEISSEEELKILQKLVKQRKDSAEIYKNQNREDLYENEIFEAEVIGEYLPKPLSDDELEKELSEIIKETGAESMKDMGKVMGTATKKLAGKADGKRISEKVRKLLG